MHTLILNSYSFNFNSDLSGDVLIRQYGEQVVALPGDLLLRFACCHLNSLRSNLSDADLVKLIMAEARK